MGEFQPPEVHVSPCPGSFEALAAVHDDASSQDPDDASRRSPTDASPGPVDDVTAGRFTAPEKIVNVARAVLDRPAGDAKVAALLGVLTSALGRRLVLNPALSLLPPLDEPDEWDEWLALLVGCSLELVSDGVDLDVDACRENGRQLLASLFEG